MYESFRLIIYILTVCESSEKLHLFVHPWVFLERKWWMSRAEFLCPLIRLFSPPVFRELHNVSICPALKKVKQESQIFSFDSSDTIGGSEVP